MWLIPVSDFYGNDSTNWIISYPAFYISSILILAYIHIINTPVLPTQPFTTVNHFVSLETIALTITITRDTNFPYFKRTLPIFVNIFVHLRPNLATSLFMASFVLLKLHVILKTSPIFCLNPPYFLDVNFGISDLNYWFLHEHLWPVYVHKSIHQCMGLLQLSVHFSSAVNFMWTSLPREGK